MKLKKKARRVLIILLLILLAVLVVLAINPFGTKEVKEAKVVNEIKDYGYKLKDKVSKTDIGGVDFVYSGILENFLQNAQNTYYKYVENNIYGNRKQALPVVSNIKVDSLKEESFKYGEKTDDKAYVVNMSWSYTDGKFSDYQKDAKLVFIHDGKKLSLVELQ